MKYENTQSELALAAALRDRRPAACAGGQADALARRGDRRGRSRENPAMKAAEFEEKAATQERVRPSACVCPRSASWAHIAYMSKDIGFDFNEMKGPAKKLAGQILGSGLIPPEMIPSITGLLNPLMNADWFLKVQDQSLGVRGRQVRAHLAGRARSTPPTAPQDQRTHGGGAGQPDPQRADLGARGALLRGWHSPCRSSRCAGRWSTACAATSKMPSRSKRTA